MFIVKRRSEVFRFALFLLLMGLLSYYVAGKVQAWRAAGRPPAAAAAATAPEVTEESVRDPDLHDYFAEFRMDRERRRGALKEMLKEVMESASADEKTRREASEQYLQEGRMANLESRAEAQVRARGFEDVTVDVAQGSAVVVVKATALTQQQFVQVVDLVSKLTGAKPSVIQVSARER